MSWLTVPADRRISRTAALLATVVLMMAAPALAQDDAEEEFGWPVEIEADKGTIIMYQPQLESFVGDRLEGRAAVALTPKSKTEPIFGAIWLVCRVATDMDTRMVGLEAVEVTAAKFPELEDQAQVEEFSSFI